MPDFSEPQRWVIPVVLLVSAVGTVLALLWEKYRPSSYTRGREYAARMASWQTLSVEAQAAHDTAVLDAAEAAENAAARTHSLYRP